MARYGVLSRANPPRTPYPLPPAERFDVLCLPIIDWGFRFQRPQQLLSRFAADGHRVFYARTGFLGLDREPGLEPVADRVFEVALPGEHDFDLYGAEPRRRDPGSGPRGDRGARRERRAFRDPVVFVQYPSWEPLARAPAGALRLAARLRLHGRAHGLRHARRPNRARTSGACSPRATSSSRRRGRSSIAVRAGRPGRAGAAERGGPGAFRGAPAARARARSRSFRGRWSGTTARSRPGSTPRPWRWRPQASGLDRSSCRRHEAAPPREPRGPAERPPVRRGALRGAARLRRRLRRLHDPVRADAADRGDQPGQALRVPRHRQAHRRPAAARARALRRRRRALRLGRANSSPRSSAPSASRTAKPLVARRREIARENTWEIRYATLRDAIARIARAGPSNSLSRRERDGVRGARASALPSPPASGRSGASTASSASSRRASSSCAARSADRERVIAEGRARVAALGEASSSAERARASRVAPRAAPDTRARGARALGNLPPAGGFAQGRRPPRAARPGRATAPGTPLFAVGSRLMPRPLARWLRRVVAPVRHPTASSRPEEREAAPGRARPTPCRRSRRAATTSSSSRSSTGTSASSARSSSRRSSAGTATASSTSRRRSSSRRAVRPGTWRARRGTWRSCASGPAARSTSTAGKLDAADVDALVAAFEALARRTCRWATPSASSRSRSGRLWPIALRERLGWRVVYDCMDEWTNFPGFGPSVLSLEEKLVRGADATIVSADRLEEKWKGHARRGSSWPGTRWTPSTTARATAPNELARRRRTPSRHRLLRRARLLGGRAAAREDRRGAPARPRSCSPAGSSTWTCRRSQGRRTCACSANGRTTRCRSFSGTSTPA